MVRRFGPNPLVAGLEVTNEGNITFSPDSSDGGYHGAREALVRGVIAAKDEARRLGHDQLRIGFNCRPPLGRVIGRGPRRPRATRHRAAARVRVSDGRLGRLRRRKCAGRR